MNSPLTVPNDDPCGAGVGVMRHAFHLFFDKVVDVPVVRRCSSSMVVTAQHGASELSAHQMVPAGAIAHSWHHLCPRASSPSFSTLVSPLRALGLGLLGRCDPRSFIFFYDITDAGPASHRVRLWQGGPASTYCRFRLLLFLFFVLVFLQFVCWLFLKFARAPGLSGGRGEMAMAVAPSARLAFFRGAACASTPYTRHFPFLVPVQ